MGKWGPRPAAKRAQSFRPQAEQGPDLRRGLQTPPEVPREQPQEAEGDGGFATPRPVPDPARGAVGLSPDFPYLETAPSPVPSVPQLPQSLVPLQLAPSSLQSNHFPARCTRCSARLRRLLGGCRDCLEEPGGTGPTGAGRGGQGETAPLKCPGSRTLPAKDKIPSLLAAERTGAAFGQILH